MAVRFIICELLVLSYLRAVLRQTAISPLTAAMYVLLVPQDGVAAYCDFHSRMELKKRPETRGGEGEGARPEKVCVGGACPEKRVRTPLLPLPSPSP